MLIGLAAVPLLLMMTGSILAASAPVRLFSQPTF
jgi:hypothetical protein